MEFQGFTLKFTETETAENVSCLLSLFYKSAAILAVFYIHFKSK